MNNDAEEPLLSGDLEPRVPVWNGEFPYDAFVSGSEIRAAASTDPYPTWIHAGLISSNERYQQPSGTSNFHEGIHSSLGEDEIRELLIDHLEHNCCWKKQIALTWKIQKVEDCNAYVGTLESFIEERSIIEEYKLYDGRKVETNGRAPGCWEVDTRAEFPPLFTPSKIVRLKLPNSEVVQTCKECKGQKETSCRVCTSVDESGKVQQTIHFTCNKCHGRGLVAHLDGSDSSCRECNGTGKVLCSSCHSKGLLECKDCNGKGAFLVQGSIIVKWTTLLSRKVIASCHASSVPDEVFQKAKGVQVFTAESQQCQPANFANSSMLSKFSQEVVAERPPIPPTARIVSERHQVTMVPVTRVVMQGHNLRTFKFYIVGLKKDLYMKDYPSKCCCRCCSSCSIL